MVVDAVTLVSGAAEGEPLRLDEPLSFWGGFDPATGRVIDRWHPQKGACLQGRVMMMPAARGSSSGSAALAEAIRLGTAPVAILLLARDAIVIVGAMVAAELYGSRLPGRARERTGLGPAGRRRPARRAGRAGRRRDPN